MSLLLIYYFMFALPALFGSILIFKVFFWFIRLLKDFVDEMVSTTHS